MATVSVNCHASDVKPSASMLTCQDGQSFISLTLDADVSVYLCGFDAASVVSARKIAASLMKVADELDAYLKEHPPVAPTIEAVIEEEVLF